jgi:Lon protease-like protein
MPSQGTGSANHVNTPTWNVMEQQDGNKAGHDAIEPCMSSLIPTAEHSRQGGLTMRPQADSLSWVCQRLAGWSPVGPSGAPKSATQLDPARRASPVAATNVQASGRALLIWHEFRVPLT